MKSRVHLALIEQTIMLLVFALSAVLCLRVFVWAESTSKENGLRDMALVQAQSAAEVLKSCGGDFAAAAKLWGGSADESGWTLCFDENWQLTESEGSYLLRVSPQDSGLEYLGRASVEVFVREESLAQLDVAWQEVEAGG